MGECAQCEECFWPCCHNSCQGLKDNFKHGLECRILKLKPVVLTNSESFYGFFRFDILIILRALFLQKTNKNKWTQMLKLEDHLDKRGPGSEIFNIVNEKVKFLQENYLKPLKNHEKDTGTVILDDVSSDLIHKLYAILDVNATEINEEFDAEILYPTASLLEHNCTPNTSQTIDESDSFRVVFRAALEIPKEAHITSIYTHILWGTQARREHLQKTKYFSCICPRCRDPKEFDTFLSGLKCLGTKEEFCGGTQLPINPISNKVKWMCDKCKIKLPNTDIMKFVNHLGDEVDKVLNKTPKVEELEEILGKLLRFLHPNHYHIYQIKHTLIQLYGRGEDDGVALSDGFLKEKIGMCENLEKITSKLDPGNSRLCLYLGVILNEMFGAKFVLLQRKIDGDNKNALSDEIKEVEELIVRNLEVLKYETKSKLLEVVVRDKIKFHEWKNNL